MHVRSRRVPSSSGRLSLCACASDADSAACQHTEADDTWYTQERCEAILDTSSIQARFYFHVEITKS